MRNDHIIIPVDISEMPMVPGSDIARKAVLKHNVSEIDLLDKYEKWECSCREIARKDDTDYRVFLNGIVTHILIKRPKNNKVLSPLSLFHVLAAMIILTEGETQREMLSAIGLVNVESVKAAIISQYRANLAHGGAEVQPSAMLWLDKSVIMDKALLRKILKEIYIGVGQGSMGDEEYHNVIHTWLAHSTGSHQSSVSPVVKIEEQTKMILMTALLFHDKWANEFDRMDSTTSIFHAHDGDIEARYMRDSLWVNIWISDAFSALPLHFEGDNEMWFVLPKEGINPEDLLSETFFTAFPPDWHDREKRDVHMKIPKFDISQDEELCDALMEFGIHSLFSDKSQTPYLKVDGNNIKVDQVKHSARITIDERGCEASAYTAMRGIAGAALPKEPPRFDFVLDRPFLFILTGRGKMPLFVGIVHKPNVA